jgi:hypothetical protein
MIAIGSFTSASSEHAAQLRRNYRQLRKFCVGAGIQPLDIGHIDDDRAQAG